LDGDIFFLILLRKIRKKMSPSKEYFAATGGENLFTQPQIVSTFAVGKKNNMLDKLQAIYERFVHLEEQIADPEVILDMGRYKKVNKEYKDLKPIIEAFLDYENVLSNLDTARQALQEHDPELQELAREEITLLEPRKEELEETLRMMLVPKDPEDSKDVIFEIRSGTGGDEASLFAGDLYRMYSRYFDSQGWKVEALEVNEGSVGVWETQV